MSKKEDILLDVKTFVEAMDKIADEHGEFIRVICTIRGDSDVYIPVELAVMESKGDKDVDIVAIKIDKPTEEHHSVFLFSFEVLKDIEPSLPVLVMSDELKAAFNIEEIKVTSMNVNEEKLKLVEIILN